MQSRNVPILSVSLALSQSAPPIVVLLGGIVGTTLAPSPVWATLPISLMIVGVALFVIPAAQIMQRIGRRRGFLRAAFIAFLGTLLAAYALAAHSFVLFCLSSLFIGLNGAFVQQYRFAAAESVEKARASRAISFVLLGGVFAGFLGPEIAKRTQNLYADELYVGSFLTLAGVYVLVILLLSFMKDVAITEKKTGTGGRPLAEIARQPNFLIAVMAGAASYGVMSFIMTATPLQMNNVNNFSFADTAWVIQSHVIAMYLPSFFTGFLIERFGLSKIMITGATILLGCTGLAIYSRELIHFWGALVLLGLGWNLLFVGGTVLLTHTYRPEERFKTQAANDFLIFGVQATASLSAGSVLYFSNWEQLNLISLGVVLAAFVVLLSQRGRLADQSAQAIKA